MISNCALNGGDSLLMGYFNPTDTIDPIFSRVQGQYPSDHVIHIGCADLAAKIYYTTDGSTPTSSSNMYTGPIPIFTGILKAIAIID